MRILEIEEINHIRDWDDVKTDAESKGLSFFRPFNGTKLADFIILLPKNYEEIGKLLLSNGMSINDIERKVQIKIENIQDYSKAANKLVTYINEIPKIIANIKNSRPENTAQREKAYTTLQRLQKASMNCKPHGIPQLFVPRIKSSKYSRPILAPAQPKIGGSKPNESFWTSSLKKEYTRNGITYYGSEWVDYIINDRPEFYRNSIGYVYKISPNARILIIRNTREAKQIFQLYKNLGTPLPDISQMSLGFPWHEIQKHWDGVHHEPTNNKYTDFTTPYSCESTAWFNTDVLEYVGKVRIRSPENKSKLKNNK